MGAPQICRHEMLGNCSWGSSCCFLRSVAGAIGIYLHQVYPRAAGRTPVAVGCFSFLWGIELRYRVIPILVNGKLKYINI